MNDNAVPNANANNNVHANAGPQTRHVNVSTLLWNAGMTAAGVIFRMYLTVLVVVYQWSVHLVGKLLTPLQPAMDQVRKVPKQDVSAQGILYQYVRLMFLIALYFTPWAVRFGAWAIEPLRKLRDWAIDYVEGPWNNGTATKARTAEKEN